MFIGATVRVRVAIEADIGSVLHERAVFVGQHAERHHEAVGEDARRCGHGGLTGRGSGVRGVEHDDFVAATGGEERVGGRFLLVAVHGIFERGHRPRPHARRPNRR